MEYALWVMDNINLKHDQEAVLILILMEYALWDSIFCRDNVYTSVS